MRPSLTFWILLAILGALLYALVVPRVGGGPSARLSATRADIASIKVILDQFRLDTGSYPRSSNGLVELVRQASGTTNWHGPYLEFTPMDPWGDPYIYSYPGKHNPNSYDLMSCGPDGKAGTDDDIGNWTK